MKSLRIASVQCRTDYSIMDNARRACKFIENANDHNVDVILFPEAMLTGYNFSVFKSDHHEECIAALELVSSKCKCLSIYCIMGLIYKGQHSDKYVNSAVCINREGSVFYKYGKIHLATNEEKELCKRGNKIALFEIDGILCTLSICRDGRHPELYRIPAMMGAKILFQPSNNFDTLEKSWWKSIAGRATQSIGSTTYIYHVVANAIGQQNPDVIVLGGSFIKDPTGLSLAEADRFSEVTIIADLKIEKATGRYAKDSLKFPEILTPFWEQMINTVLEHKDYEIW